MINTLLAKIGMGIVATATVIAGWLGVNPQQLGSTVPLTPALFETSLASPISISDLSMTLAKGTLLDGTTLSGYTCFTVDSGQPNLEYICGTASGTAITSLIRGVNPLNGTTSVAALTYSHRRGANVKVTDYPALSIQGRILSGLDGIPNEVYYDTNYSFATSSNKTVVTKGYVDGIAIAGSPIMTTSVQGIGKLSTASASSTNPIVVGDNDTRVPTQAENDALTGSFGTPSSSNRYLTESDATSTVASSSRLVRYTSTGQITATTTPVATTDATSKAYVDSYIPKYATGIGSIGASGNATSTIGFTPKLLKFTAIKTQGANARPSFSSGVWVASSTAATIAATTNVLGSTENANGAINGLITGSYLTYTDISTNLGDPCYSVLASTSTTGFTITKTKTYACGQDYVWEAWGN